MGEELFRQVSVLTKYGALTCTVTILDKQARKGKPIYKGKIRCPSCRKPCTHEASSSDAAVSGAVKAYERHSAKEQRKADRKRR